MKKFLKRYKLTLTTIAPVHIGSGKTYNSKEYIYENGQFYFPDMGKLYSYVDSKGKSDSFEKFLMNSGNHNNNEKPRLIDYLKQQAINERNFGGYYISGTGFESSTYNQRKRTSYKDVIENMNLNAIPSFIRDGLNYPYIPGSSLKGAIRTILLNTHYEKNNFVSSYQKNGKPEVKENKNIIPWGAKKNKDFDDIFNMIRVSDSKPLSNDDLIIAQKWDFSSISFSAKPLPLQRECIKPNTKIEFIITVEGDKANDLIKSVSDNAYEFYKELTYFFLAELDNNGDHKFNSDYIQRTYRDQNYAPLYLGGGSGVWTKTVFKQAEKYVKNKYGWSKIVIDKSGKKKELNRTKMVGKGTLKLTKTKEEALDNKVLIDNNENFYEMGKCIFKIEEID